MNKQHLLIIGCGYLGKRVARKFINSGWNVSALTRSEIHAEHFRQMGITPLLGDIMLSDSLKAIPHVDVALLAVGYDRTSQFTMQDIYIHGLENVLLATSGKTSRFIHISSTSVYGQEQGEWIDEKSPTIPSKENGRICLAAEDLVRDQLTPDDEFTILRLAGIYGPDRTLSRIEQLKLQVPITGSGSSWLNLIHVDDAADLIYECSTHIQPETLYLVSDNEPVAREVYYNQLASLANAPAPVFQGENTERTSGMNKRCSNHLVKKHMNWQPAYPDFRSGLNQIFHQS